MSDAIQVEVEEVNAATRNLKISVGTAAVQEAVDEALQKVRKKANIKGFRKGKAPVQMIQRLYQDEIQSEAIYALLDSSYLEALKQTNLHIVSRPEIKDLQFSAGQPLQYVATVEIMPEIKLKKYTGFEVTVGVDDAVPENAVGERLEQIRQAQAQLKPLDPPHPCEKGDFIVVDIEATIDGKPFPPGSGKNVLLELGGGNAFAGFDDHLFGKSVKDTVAFDLTLPKDLENFGGQVAHFVVKILEQKIREVPELNDDLAKDLGEFASLDELRTQIGEELRARIENTYMQEVNNGILAALVVANPFDVPQSMVQDEAQRLLEDFRKRLAQQGHTLGENDPLYVKLHEDCLAQAEKRVRGGLILDAVAKVEHLDVSDEDLQRYLQNLSTQMRRPVDEVRAVYERQKAMGGLKLKMLEEKTLEFIRGKAKIIKNIKEEEKDPE